MNETDLWLSDAGKAKLMLAEHRGEIVLKLLRLGEERCHVQFSDTLEYYLYVLVSRFVSVDEVMVDALHTRTMVSSVSESIEASSTMARFHALHMTAQLGLIIVSLFPGFATRRLVRPIYYRALSRAAYRSIDHLVEAHPDNNVLKAVTPPVGELDNQFDLVWSVLAAMRDNHQWVVLKALKQRDKRLQDVASPALSLHVH